ncbi:MAG: 50S ribosomal protein L11 methyltransferase [Deltaproteobacteria bacterium]|jgi:ribosomal protein L11 methyltransferase|nr:50S ribosomal protein L11 methyltransferase [Deltaproteobacteria bacterium]
MSPEQNSPYAVAVVKNLDRSQEDEATAILFEFGAEGVAEDLPFIQRDLRYDPELVAAKEMILKAYYSNPPSEELRFALEAELRRLNSSVVFSMTLEAHRDWLEEWKKGFVPFKFAEPFWVVPKWCNPPEGLADVHTLWMDPGMAFGTGTHETTQLAAALTVEWMAKRTSAKVLDVGTGTGILALITERMGAEVAVGLDIDPEARRTARENLELNKSKKTLIDDRDISEIAQECVQKKNFYDLTIANIIDGVLLVLAVDLAATVRPRGTMILSGILTDREEEFHREFALKTGLEEQRRIRQGEWCASVWYKPV